MAKFCGKCGSKLNEQGKCTNCKTQAFVSVKKIKFSNEIIRKNMLKFCIFFVSILLIVATTVSILAYWHIINIPAISCLNKKMSLKKDFSSTIDVVLGKNESEVAYISDMVSFSEDSYQIFEDTNVSRKITSEIKYSIDDIEINRTSGIAKIHFIAPDVYKIISDAINNSKSFDSTQDLLNHIIETLSGEYPVIEQTVESSFELINDHWYWSPSKDVLNILSGNLYQYFENLEFFNNVNEQGE